MPKSQFHHITISLILPSQYNNVSAPLNVTIKRVWCFSGNPTILPNKQQMPKRPSNKSGDPFGEEVVKKLYERFETSLELKVTS